MPAPERSLAPRKLIVGLSMVSVNGFSFSLVQNRWSYLLPVVPSGQGERLGVSRKLSRGFYCSCAIAAVGEPN